MYTVICSAKLRPCLCGLIQKFLSLKCLKDITFLSVEHRIPHNSFFFSRACILPDHCHATVSYNKRQHLFFPKYFPNCSPNSVNMDLIPLSFTFPLPSPPSNPNFQKTTCTVQLQPFQRSSTSQGPSQLSTCCLQCFHSDLDSTLNTLN